ncbi:glycosyltransferase family 2 protein [Ferruginibacter lapsinanis]|uniref:glycosyltransferase family 2 protein n=1 Tax=Ferruginibacter lapsinanis TaxID=563172 RepID=UPI001E54A2FD|nr:glycosyltransferase family A protein [Ferruginibacter lapsinanis]
MTSYNREKYIGEAIESVLRSTYQNWELIIVDDASKDRTVEIARSYAEKDERIKLHVNEINLGDYANRNKAAGYAKGEYLKYLDSDDKICPWGLGVMVECMESDASIAMGFSSNILINCMLPVVLSPEESFKLYFFRGFLLGIGPSGTIIRRDVFESFNGFSGRQFVGDTELWFKIASKHSVVCMPANLVYWREHEQQQIVLERKDFHIESVRLAMIRETLVGGDCPLQKSDADAAYRNIVNIKCRGLIKSLLAGKFRESFARIRTLKLSFTDFLLSLKKNVIPVLRTPIHDFNN